MLVSKHNSMMTSPRDDTAIIRMLRDFKDAIFESGHRTSPSPSSSSFIHHRRRMGTLDASDVALKLNFSSLDEPTKLRSLNSSSAPSTQTPDQLKRKLAHTEVELQASIAALKEKETVITMMEPTNKKMRLSLEQKLEESRRQSEMDQDKINQLKTQLKQVQSEASFAKNRVIELEKESKIECHKLEMKVLALQQECSNLRLEVSEIKSAKAETCGKLNNEINRLELKLSSLNDEYSVSKSIIASLKKQISDLTEKATSAISLEEELSAAQSMIKSLENKIASDEDAALVVKSMQSDLKLLSELRKENLSLREELSKYKESNVALFQEKMWAFQEKLAQAEKKNIAMAKLQVENETLKTKLENWESLYDDDSGSVVKSPSTFSRRLSNYQKNELLLTNKVANLTSHCENLEKKNVALEATVEHLKKCCDQAKQSSIAFEPFVKRLQKKIFLLTKERDNCRKLIDSYVNETTMSGAVLNTLHIKTLEDTIADYKKSLELAEKEIESLDDQVKSLLESKKNLADNEALLKRLQEENLQLQATIDDLKASHSSLESNVAGCSGGVVPRKEKIIHFKFNPFDEAVEKKFLDFKNLQEENDKLRKRVKVLEEGGSNVCDVTAKVAEKLEVEGSESLLKSLKEQLAKCEKQNKLIIETARSASREFREAVYALTGYKVDAPGSGKYKLSHVYADSPNDYLLFDVNAEGVHLLETPYSSQLTGLIETYLKTYDSVPAFLASITMELFKQQTCVISH